MIDLWIFGIALFLIIAMSVVSAVMTENRRKMVERRVMDLEDELQNLTEANNDPAARYVVEPVFPGFILSHRTWGVYRKSNTSLNNPVSTLIRVFDDSDEEFNHREAQELCDILNGK